MTYIFPLTGSLSLTTIDQLTGTSGVPSAQPFKLSTFGGQDFDIPRGTTLRYSDFYGAINYYKNIGFRLTNVGFSNYDPVANNRVGYTNNSQSTSTILDNAVYMVYYRNNGQVYRNPYYCLQFGDINGDLDIKTKHSTNTRTTTYALINANITFILNGYLDHDVTIYMQVNDEQYTDTVQSNSTSTTLTNKSLTDILADLHLSKSAPQVIAAIGGENVPDPFLFITDPKVLILNPSLLQNRVAFTNKSTAILNQLINYANTLSPNLQYTGTLAVDSHNVVSITLNQLTYTTANFPLCYSITTVEHHSPGQGNGGITATIKLNNYGVKLGDSVKFYMGAGPGSPTQGYIWGNFTVNYNINNTPLLTF